MGSTSGGASTLTMNQTIMTGRPKPLKAVVASFVELMTMTSSPRPSHPFPNKTCCSQPHRDTACLPGGASATVRLTIQNALVCVCVCVVLSLALLLKKNTHSPSLCMCVRAYVCVCAGCTGRFQAVDHMRQSELVDDYTDPRQLWTTRDVALRVHSSFR